ncbi:MAG TPA: HD domain-containing protein [Candidatus Binatia bacterium]|nr:HD domain-containing protein [Candidatus Binatia bacterium]
MTDTPSLSLHKLPDEVADLVQRLDVHPYLLAHLILVHDAAWRLLEGLSITWPSLDIDQDQILFGAGIHDIGKVSHPEEMVGPGRRHHKAGEALLKAEGIAPHKARFARTHGAWENMQDLAMEDLLVALADTIWAGGRNRVLEDRVTERLAATDGRELWRTYMDLDDILMEITNDAELRLVWQTQFAPNRESLEQGGEPGPQI